MKNDRIFSFISNQLKSVEGHLFDFKKDKDIEHLHGLRLCIKKVCAVFSFVKNIYKKKCEVDVLQFLFKKAGEIRELHNNIVLLSLLPVPPQTLILQLKKKERSLRKKFTKHIPQYLLLVKKFRKETCFAFPLPNKKSIKNYFKRKRKKADKRFNQQKRENLHGFRKLIKKLLYVYALLPPKTQKMVKFKKGFINKLQDEVGTWHDTYAAITFLSGKNFNQKAEYLSILRQKEADQFEALLSKYPDLKL